MNRPTYSIMVCTHLHLTHLKHFFRRRNVAQMTEGVPKVSAAHDTLLSNLKDGAIEQYGASHGWNKYTCHQ